MEFHTSCIRTGFQQSTYHCVFPDNRKGGPRHLNENINRENVSVSIHYKLRTHTQETHTHGSRVPDAGTHTQHHSSTHTAPFSLVTRLFTLSLCVRWETASLAEWCETAGVGGGVGWGGYEGPRGHTLRAATSHLCLVAWDTPASSFEVHHMEQTRSFVT